MATAYERNIVEIREEYTTHLVNLLTPLIYEGVESIYKYAHHIDSKLKEAKKETQGRLKIFQNLLARIPKWNQDLIEKETHRIKQSSRCSDWFDDLIKAVVKSNITLLTFTSASRSRLIKERFHDKVNVNDFIHKCYIQCAKGVYNNPYLFWDEGLDPIDIKRNQRDACELIKDSIREAIRRMLPVKNILQEYLGTSYTQEEFEDKDFDHTISEAQYRNLKEMVSRDVKTQEQGDYAGGNKDDRDDREDHENEERNVIIQDEKKEAKPESILKSLLGDTSPSKLEMPDKREMGAPVYDPPKMAITSLIAGGENKSPKMKPEISNPSPPPIQTPPTQTPPPQQTQPQTQPQVQPVSQPVTIQTTVQLPDNKVQLAGSPSQTSLLAPQLISQPTMQKVQELFGNNVAPQSKPPDLKPNLITQSTTSMINNVPQTQQVMIGGGVMSEDSISMNIKEGDDEYEDVYSNVIHTKKKVKKNSKPSQSQIQVDRPKVFANYTKVI